MKKIYYVVLLIFIVTFFSCSKPLITNTDLYRENLNGKVSLIEDILYSAHGPFEELIADSISDKNLYHYNEYGNHLSDEEYDNKGKPGWITKYFYDEMNKNTGIDIYYNDDSLYHKYLFVFNKSGNKIICNRFNSDGKLFSKSNYVYNSNNNMISENQYDSEGKLSTSWYFKYDNNGNKIETEWKIAYQEEISSHHKYIYDENRNLLRDSTLNSEGKNELSSEWKYINFDDNQNWTKRMGHNNQNEFIEERKIEYIK